MALIAPLLSGYARSKEFPPRSGAGAVLICALENCNGCREHLQPKVHALFAALRALTCAVGMAGALPAAAEAANWHPQPVFGRASF
jgi:hypothetical protein